MIMSDVARRKRDSGSGSVTKRADGRWMARCSYRDENDCARRKAFYGKSKTDALNAMRDWLADGGPARPTGRELKDLIEHVLTVILPAQQLDQDTIDDYRGFERNHITPRIGSVPLEKLSVRHLDSVAIEMMEDGRSPKTAKNCAVFLGQCLREGKRLGWLKDDLASDMMEIRTQKYKAKIYNLAQVEQLVATSAGSRVQPAIVLGVMMGLREAELAGLMWSDVDFDTLSITVQRQKKGTRIKDQTKTDAGMRTLPMPPFVKTYLQTVPRDGLFLMMSVDGTKAINPSVIYHETMRLMDAAEIPRIRFHDLRHTANNLLKQLGVAAETRRDILGHAHVATTQNVYTQTVDSEMVEAMQRLENALRWRA